MEVAALDLEIVDGEAVEPVRSGEILAGPLDGLMGVGRPGHQDFRAKIFWVPLDPNVAADAEMTLTIEHLDAETAINELRLVGAHSGESYFWPSSVPLPDAGRWRLTASAPGHWGCFDIEVPDET